MRLTRRHSEAGFTLIELVVGMVISVVVLAMILSFVVGLFDSSDRVSMRQKAQASTILAVETLTSDLRAMRAPQREPKFTGTIETLRVLLIEPVPSDALLVHDILQARPDRIRFFAEVANGTPGVECVTWRVRSDLSLVREVRPQTAPSCDPTGVAPIQETIMMPAPEVARASAAAQIPNPFSYRLLSQPNLANPNPANCTSVALPGPLGLVERNQVTGIHLDLRGFYAHRSGRGDQQLRTTVSIASRQGLEYRYAIGCAS